ncbi:hypothetical protein K2173_010970 [Erythroxylum novogranatense]|uniref:Nuclear pore complex protein NUP214 n=1 Tax=Erythroxylum novogranatense TaxID=1862640 RepID=A0AAV8T171_9ROSI|nr:hypothetical protein K2173_010970 [Erythroxylum novogranatense]
MGLLRHWSVERRIQILSLRQPEMENQSREAAEEKEGEHLETTDYYFDRIGKSIPISSLFDTQNPPSCPVAVSQHHRLIFLALSDGFIGARIKDVMDASEEFKSDNKGKASSCSSIHDLSVFHVPIGNVRILALSTDSSTLAVATDTSRICFFSLTSLLMLNNDNNDTDLKKPSSECSLNQPNSVIKDFLWTRKSSDSSYLVLSDNGKLYHGSLGSSLQHVLDSVDAVDWSVKGALIAVARGNALCVFSSKFKKKFSMSLPINSWVGGSADDNLVKVDSIRWVRPDSIVVGYFQQTAEGKEEGYFLQVIRSKDGKIADDTSNLIVLSFYDLFPGVIDDIVSYGHGPYLLLSYLEECGLAITANKKNTDQHIVLLGWSVDGNVDETVVIDIDRDTWLPRIELQDNGDDNLILGLCIDKVSLYGKVKVEVGVEEKKELPPHCMLICVTFEGKLVMFRVASIAGPTCPSENELTLSDEEEDDLVDLPNTPGNGELESEKEAANLQWNDVREMESNVDTFKQGLKPSGRNESSTAILVTEKAPPVESSVTTNRERESPVTCNSVAVIAQESNTATNMHQDINGQTLNLYGKQSVNFTHSPLRSSFQEGPANLVKNASEYKKSAEFVFDLPASSGKASTTSFNQFNQKGVHKNVELAGALQGKTRSTVAQEAVSQSFSSRSSIFSDGSGNRSPFLPSNLIERKESDGLVDSAAAANAPHNLAGKPFHLKDHASISSLVDSSVREDRPADGTGIIESLPSISMSQFSSQENFAFGRSNNRGRYSPKDNYKALPLSNSEANLSGQFGNIKEMAKELDALLQSIEESGGFRDACTVSQRSSVEALEEGLETVSEKCGMWKILMDEKLVEVQRLLDNTVQVLAQKVYLDGIVKQASDSQYWELWNRQKLSSALDLKRQTILKLSQDLTNQLIKLERHFNSLELQRFGENDEAHLSGRAFQSRYGPSRHIQSLHSLHNTMSSQLTAAERLSECLAKQMAVLNIDLLIKQKNVKRELFETIGIPYDASFSPSDATPVGDTSSAKNLSLSPSSSAKDQSRRRLSSAMKSSDPETRRRRNSLDQSLACFEPTKTTVKRVFLQENQKKTPRKLQEYMDRQYVRYSLSDGSNVTKPDIQTSYSTLLQSGDGSVQYKFPKQTSEKRSTLFKWANESPLSSQAAEVTSLSLPSNNVESPPVSRRELMMTWQNHAEQANGVTADESRSPVSSTEKPHSTMIHEKKFGWQYETSPGQKHSPANLLHETTFLLKSSEVPNASMSKGSVVTNSVPYYPKHGFDTESLVPTCDSKKNDPGFLSLPTATAAVNSVAHPAHTVSEVPSPFHVGTSTHGEVSSPAFSVPFSASSSTSDSSLKSLPTSFTASSIFDFANDGKSTASKPPPSVNYSSPSTLESPKSEVQNIFKAPLSVPLRTELNPPLEKAPPSLAVTSVSYSPKTEVQPPKGEIDSQKNMDDATAVASLQPKPPALDLKVKSSIPINEISTGFISGTQSSLNIVASSTSNITIAGQPQQTSVAHTPFTAILTTSNPNISGKNESLDVAVAEEDEMEEEAPESGNRGELSLGSLGGFGIGSTPSTAAPRGNPFGGSYNAGTSQTSSAFSMTAPSGELFRPASFSFQPPQPSQLPPQNNLGAFSGGLNTGTVATGPTQGGFGQPAQIGSGQQALGSVLGAFGQSRQLGTGFSANGLSSAGSFTGGFANTSSQGGFPNATSGGGGFAAVASGGGGFAGAASAGRGFGDVGSANIGFAAAASGRGFAAAGGGGFGGFSSQQGGGGFSAFGSSQQGGNVGFPTFGSNTGGSGKPPELFTQMRK